MAEKNYRGQGALIFLGCSIGLLIYSALMGLLVFTQQARGHDSDPEISRWMANLYDRTTGQRCCGESDAYMVSRIEEVGGKLYAVINDTRDIPMRPKLPPGTRVEIPPEKWGATFPKGNPTETTWIFLSTQMKVYCIVMGTGT